VLADAGRGRRPEVQVGERGAEVEACPADHDRPVSRVQRPVDLRVREPCVLPGGCLCGHRQHADQTVLQSFLLGTGGRTGENAEAAVELQRVRRDRDGRLAGGAQPLRQPDGDGGLADPGGAEQGHHRARGRHRSASRRL
jgi:hypothetical protein